MLKLAFILSAVQQDFSESNWNTLFRLVLRRYFDACSVDVLHFAGKYEQSL